MAKISVLKETCKGCYLCVPACKRGLIHSQKTSMNRSGYFPVDFVDPDSQCNGCKLCAIVCPDIAIRVYK